MSRIRIAGRNVSVRDIALHGPAGAWSRSGSRSPHPLSSRDLSFGDHGRDVAVLRETLRRAGVRGVVPGGVVFDRELEERVREYQARHHLRTDGRVGRSTRESLERAAH